MKTGVKKWASSLGMFEANPEQISLQLHISWFKGVTAIFIESDKGPERLNVLLFESFCRSRRQHIAEKNLRLCSPCSLKLYCCHTNSSFFLSPLLTWWWCLFIFAICPRASLKIHEWTNWPDILWGTGAIVCPWGVALKIWLWILEKEHLQQSVREQLGKDLAMC